MSAEANKYKFQFVSDLHLGSPSDPKFLLFKKYLQSVIKSKVTHLFLLGDIFDLWVADQKYFIKQYEPITAEIKKIIQAGIKVYYFEGNHDLHLKKYWQDELGCTVYDSAQRLSISGVDLLLAHGDEIDKDDHDYIRLRKFFRSPVITFLAHYLPGFMIKRIGKTADNKSHGHYLRENQDASRVLNLIRGFAHSEYEVQEYDFCFTGHFHLRDEHKVDKALAINLGTWLDQPGYYELTSKGYGFHNL